MLKKIGIIFGVLLLLILVLLFIAITRVDHDPYFKESYYQTTIARLDSLQPITSNGAIEAGFARVSITPQLQSSKDDGELGQFKQMPLAGYGARKGKYASGVHDSIFVKAAAIKVGGQTMVIVGADLLIMPPAIIDSVTALLAADGIQRSQVYYSASHTHSSLGAWGPGIIGKEFAGEENPVLEHWLARQIAAAVRGAVADLKPATISTGNFTIPQYTANRLIGKTGNKNDDFTYIRLEQKGARKAIIGSYSAHATTLGADNLAISADYPGYWQRKLEASGFDCAVFVAGSVGSQSPAADGDGFDKPKQLGEALADSLTSQLAKQSAADTISLAAITLQMQLPEYHIRLTEELNLSSAVSHQLLPFPDHAYLQAMRLGKMIWITTPCDFSGEFAMQLKLALAADGYLCNVSSFNGGYVGYIIPERYFYLDAYEPRVMGWFGLNMGEYMMDLIRQLSRKLAGRDNI